MNLFSDESIRQTVLIAAIVFGQAFYMLNYREMTDTAFTNRMTDNKALIWSLVVMGGLQLMMIYLYPLQQIVQTHALTIGQLAISIAPAFLLFVVVEIEKNITRRRFKV